MFSPYHHLGLYWLLPSIVRALNIPTDQNSINQPSLPLLANITRPIALLNASTLNGQLVRCEGGLRRPQISSCQDALAQIPFDASAVIGDPTYSYGPRGQGNFDVGLPFRWISSDGQCIIDLSQTSSPSYVRYINLIGSARLIQSQCIARGQPPWAGQATNLGQEENFQVTTQGYRPPFIRCQSQPPTTRPTSSACATILNIMKASTGQTSFAARGAGPAVEILPQILSEPTGQCTITVDLDAPEDVGSWYDIWQAAVALDGMCARSGKAGRARFLGTGRKLKVDIKK